MRLYERKISSFFNLFFLMKAQVNGPFSENNNTNALLAVKFKILGSHGKKCTLGPYLGVMKKSGGGGTPCHRHASKKLHSQHTDPLIGCLTRPHWLHLFTTFSCAIS